MADRPGADRAAGARSLGFTPARPPKPATSLAERSLRDAGLPEGVAELIVATQRQVDAAYRQQAAATADALTHQAASINRLSALVEVLLERIPATTGEAPIRALSFAPAEESDLARVPEGVAADPIGAGYRLTQTDMARILRCKTGDLGILLKESGLRSNIRFAVQVRSENPIWNYHKRAIDEVLRYVEGDAVPKEGTKAVGAVTRIIRARQAGG